METRIVEIAERIKGLREMMDITPEEMAEAAGVELEEYLKHENGEQDFGFTFLYKCADKLDVDIVELLTGENPGFPSTPSSERARAWISSAEPGLSTSI